MLGDAPQSSVPSRQLGPWVGLPDLADKNTGLPVKYEFQKNNEAFFSVNMARAMFGMYLH